MLPDLQDWASTYAQVSYEIGGDVFSLQELEHCVLRGKLPRPAIKDLPKRFLPLPPEDDDHYMYTLTKASRPDKSLVRPIPQANIVLAAP